MAFWADGFWKAGFWADGFWAEDEDVVPVAPSALRITCVYQPTLTFIARFDG